MSDHRSRDHKPQPSPQHKHHADLDFEIKFFEGLIAESPDFLDVLIPLAEAYTQCGHYQKGLETDQKICCLQPNDAIAHYNLACSFALLGRVAEALEALEKSLALGYSDLRHLVRDSDLENLKSDPRLPGLLHRYFPRNAGKSSTSL